MKKLFLFLRSKIKTAPSIKWVDADKGQLNKYEKRPEIDFPAVLLKIEYPLTANISNKTQQCSVVVTATVAFDYMDDTSGITEEDSLQESLEFYDIADEVHQLIQGTMDVEVIRTPLERTSLRDPIRPDQIKTLVYTYSTKLFE